VSEVVNQWPSGQRGRAHPEEKKEKQVPLLRQVYVHARPHFRQSKQRAQQGQYYAKHKHAGAAGCKQAFHARRLYVMLHAELDCTPRNRSAWLAA
jgi:hypothetical protein